MTRTDRPPHAGRPHGKHTVQVIGEADHRTVLADPRVLSDDELARRLYGLAIVVAKWGRPKNSTIDFEEVVAEAWVKLFKACRRWQPGIGDPISYAVGCARWSWLLVANRQVAYGPRGRNRLTQVPLEWLNPHSRPDDEDDVESYQPPSIPLAELEAWKQSCEPLAWRALVLLTLSGVPLGVAAQRLKRTPEEVVELARRAATAVRHRFGRGPKAMRVQFHDESLAVLA